MNIITIQVGGLNTNCYLVVSAPTKETIIIDPGDDPDKIIELIESEKLKPKFIVNTHSHADHLRGNPAVSKKYNIPCYIGEKGDKFIKDWKSGYEVFFGIKAKDLKFKKKLKEGEVLKCGEISLKVMETPGHSPGGICLYGHGILFSGDTLFAGDVGRTDLPGGSHKELSKTYKMLMKFPGNTRVFPGHGRVTDIQEQKETNLFNSEMDQSE